MTLRDNPILSVIPAAPGWFILEDLSSVSEPSEDGVLRTPIVAWVVREGFAAPVTDDPFLGERQEFGILRPDGTVLAVRGDGKGGPCEDVGEWRRLACRGGEKGNE